MVPAVTDVSRPQAAHSKSPVRPRQALAPPHCRHRKPSGQRHCSKYARHAPPAPRTATVYAFNSVATDFDDGQPIVEGRILHRLLDEPDTMNEALAGRVFDVTAEVLSLNDANLTPT
jgi:hypothetical protein